jgi:hypothetical protein
MVGCWRLAVQPQQPPQPRQHQLQQPDSLSHQPRALSLPPLRLLQLLLWWWGQLVQQQQLL